MRSVRRFQLLTSSDLGTWLLSRRCYDSGLIHCSGGEASSRSETEHLSPHWTCSLTDILSGTSILEVLTER